MAFALEESGKRPARNFCVNPEAWRHLLRAAILPRTVRRISTHTSLPALELILSEYDRAYQDKKRETVVLPRGLHANPAPISRNRGQILLPESAPERLQPEQLLATLNGCYV